MSRRLLLVPMLAFILGCPGTVGPFAARQPQRVDDPCITIPEQERRARDRLPLPQPEPSAGPRTFLEPIGSYGPTH